MPSSAGSVGLARAHPLTKTQAMEPSRETRSSHGPPYLPVGALVLYFLVLFFYERNTVSLNSPLIFRVLLRVIVCPIHRVMHDYLFPLMLLLIKLRPTNVNKVAYISHSHIFRHSLSSTAVRFCPPRQGLDILDGHIKPVVRTIGVSHAACKDEFRPNPRSHS